MAQEFTAARRAAGRRRGRSLRSLALVLAALAGAGMLAADPLAGPPSEQERLLAAFGQYLRCERALAAGTAGAYVARAGRFLDGLGGDLDGLAAGDVTAAVLAEAEKVSAGSAQYFVAALRAFLRFCHLEGHTAADLAWAAQAVTGRRRSSLPKGISQADARALLAGPAGWQRTSTQSQVPSVAVALPCRARDSSLGAQTDRTTSQPDTFARFVNSWI